MAHTNYTPARKGDVLELPANPAAPVGSASVCRDTAPDFMKQRNHPKRRTTALALGAGLALLSAFIPLSVQEADAASLYVSGGGGGSSSFDATVGNGGAYAGAGKGEAMSGNPPGAGGGAYVGDGLNANNSRNGGLHNTTGQVDFVSNPDLASKAHAENSAEYSGGHAYFSTKSLSGYDVYVESGRRGFSGDGGNATFEVDTLSKGTKYTFTNNFNYSGSGGGALYATIGTLDVTDGDVTFTVDRTAARDVRIANLVLGNGKAFTVSRANSGDFTVESYTVRGEATFNGALNAVGKTMNFYVPSSMGDGGTMLTVIGGAADIRSSTVNVGIDGASSPLSAGDQVVLVDASATSLTGTPANSMTNGQGMQGVTLRYEFDLSTDSNQLLATVRSLGLNPQTKALSEGFLSGLALTTQGADVIAGQGMGNAVSATAGGNGFGAFGAVSGGSMRYNTGSHVDMNSVSLMTGLAWGVDTTPGHLTLGAFFEYGNGSYDTNNSFSNAASVNGDGDAYYMGGGVLGRMEFPVGGTRRTGSAAAALSRAEGDGFEPGFTPGEETSPTASAGTGSAAPSVIYVEASARIGKVHNEYGSSDLQFNNIDADFDSSSLYYGLHLGTGYIWNITEAASLDLYGKYFWTRQEGDSVTLSTNDPVAFKDADSHRLRGGARFSYALNEYVSPYIGAAYEHEFDGKARASTYGYGINAPSLRGDTGIGEIGLALKPSATLPLSFDLGVQGYTGKREGVTGSLQVKFEF